MALNIKPFYPNYIVVRKPNINKVKKTSNSSASKNIKKEKK